MNPPKEYILISWHCASFGTRTLLVPKAEFIEARPKDYEILKASIESDGKIHQWFTKETKRSYASVHHPFSSFMGWLEMVDGDEDFIGIDDAQWFYKSWWNIDIGPDLAERCDDDLDLYLRCIELLDSYKGTPICVTESFVVVEEHDIPFDPKDLEDEDP